MITKYEIVPNPKVTAIISHHVNYTVEWYYIYVKTLKQKRQETLKISSFYTSKFCGRDVLLLNHEHTFVLQTCGQWVPV